MVRGEAKLTVEPCETGGVFLKARGHLPFSCNLMHCVENVDNVDRRGATHRAQVALASRHRIYMLLRTATLWHTISCVVRVDFHVVIIA